MQTPLAVQQPDSRHRNVAGCIHIRVIRVATGYTFVVFVVPTNLVDIPTGIAGPRDAGGVDLGHASPVFELLPGRMPTGVPYLPVQSCLPFHVPARLVHRPPGRPGHALRVRLLDNDR